MGLLNVMCRGNKRDGSPCRTPATGANGFCWAHDPAHAERRRQIASRGGQGKAGGELRTLKTQLRGLADAVLAGSVDRADAAVTNQILNTILRVVEQERKERELRDLEERLTALEATARGTKGQRWQA